jgi:hypothetical protein
MSLLNKVVNLAIKVQSSTLTLPGFGTPLILAATVPAGFTDPSKGYTSPADMLTDGFLENSQEYKDALRISQQSPRVPRIVIGKRAAAVAQVDVVTPIASNTHLYELAIDDSFIVETVDYTSDGTATRLEICTNLMNTINALPAVFGVTASVTGPGGSETLTLTADNPGIPFTTTEGDVNLSVATTVANVGMAQDLATIDAYDSDFYGVLIPERTLHHIAYVASVIETSRRQFFAQCNDPEIISAPYNGASTTTDIASFVKGKAYDRTSIWRTPNDSDSLAAGAAGVELPETPGSITLQYKTVIGETASKLTDAERDNLQSKNANAYLPIAGVSVVFGDTVASGEYIDVIHGIDKLYSRIQELVFLALKGARKVPFTNKGIALVVAQVRAALLESVRDGLIADSRLGPDGKFQVPAFTITAPDVSEIAADDRAARRIPSGNPITFEATLAGAIHFVSISGTVSV